MFFPSIPVILREISLEHVMPGGPVSPGEHGYLGPTRTETFAEEEHIARGSRKIGNLPSSSNKKSIFMLYI
jgi:hypothetical protein